MGLSGMRLLGHGIGKHRGRCGCTNGFMAFAIILQSKGIPYLCPMQTAQKSTGTCGHKPQVGPITTAIFSPAMLPKMESWLEFRAVLGRSKLATLFRGGS